MKIVLVSNNANKLAELRALTAKFLIGVEVLSLSDIGFSREIVEDGETFEENALIKAKAVSSLGYTAVADDSGLSVDALGGEPGVRSARYAGEPCDNAKNNEKLLEKMKNFGAGERGASFISVIAGVFPDGRKVVSRGECRGEILTEYRGTKGFGYDPLFYYPPLKKTYAQMSAEEKNGVSHRARAFEKFFENFKKEL